MIDHMSGPTMTRRPSRLWWALTAVLVVIAGAGGFLLGAQNDGASPDPEDEMLCDLIYGHGTDGYERCVRAS